MPSFAPSRPAARVRIPLGTQDQGRSDKVKPPDASKRLQVPHELRERPAIRSRNGFRSQEARSPLWCPIKRPVRLINRSFNSMDD
jgi:hypothetical protein